MDVQPSESWRGNCSKGRAKERTPKPNFPKPHKAHETEDTLLVVHTLLLTFALATLQYSDQFVPVSGGTDMGRGVRWARNEAQPIALPAKA